MKIFDFLIFSSLSKNEKTPEALDFTGFSGGVFGVPEVIRTPDLPLRRTIEHLSSVFTYVQESRYPSGFFRIPSRSVSVRVHLCR